MSIDRQRSKGGIARNAWLAALEEVQTAEPPSDPHVMTVMEFGALIGMGRARAEHRLKLLVAAGKATRCEKRIRRADGHLMSVAAYRLTVEP